VIGVLPGHALLGAQFTATSMIGTISLAITLIFGILISTLLTLVLFPVLY